MLPIVSSALQRGTLENLRKSIRLYLEQKTFKEKKMIEPLHGTLLEPREVVAKKNMSITAGRFGTVGSTKHLEKESFESTKKSNTKVVMEVNDDVLKKDVGFF